MSLCYDISTKPGTTCVAVVDIITNTVVEVRSVSRTPGLDYSTLSELLTSLMNKYSTY